MNRQAAEAELIFRLHTSMETLGLPTEADGENAALGPAIGAGLAWLGIAADLVDPTNQDVEMVPENFQNLFLLVSERAMVWRLLGRAIGTIRERVGRDSQTWGDQFVEQLERRLEMLDKAILAAMAMPGAIGGPLTTGPRPMRYTEAMWTRRKR